MKYSFKAWCIGHFFHSACKKEYKRRSIPKKAVMKIALEHKMITIRAKNMSHGKLMSSYLMGIYFIAMNRYSGLSAQENYDILEAAMRNNRMFKKGLGTAEQYLDEKNTPARMKWAEESHKVKGENNWVVDVLPRCKDFDLGYDYHECGICKICRDEGCFELAKYLCRLDYVIADMMGVKLVRTQTLAEGGDFCDFRYSLK